MPATKSAPATNGAVPAPTPFIGSEPLGVPPAATPPPGRVIGQRGASVWLAQQEFHWVRFTAPGLRELQVYLDTQQTGLIALPSDDTATYGQMVADGFALPGAEAEATKRLLSLYQRTIEEPFSEDLLNSCTADEIADSIDQLLHQSGMRFFERMLKNGIRQRLEAALAQLPPASPSVPTSPANPST